MLHCSGAHGGGGGKRAHLDRSSRDQCLRFVLQIGQIAVYGFCEVSSADLKRCAVQDFGDIAGMDCYRVRTKPSCGRSPEIGGRWTCPDVALVAVNCFPGAGLVCGAVEWRLKVDGELEGEG